MNKREKEKVIRDYIKAYWGKRCKSTDWEDFPEMKGLRHPEGGVCGCCEAWRSYDYIVGKHFKD